MRDASTSLPVPPEPGALLSGELRAELMAVAEPVTFAPGDVLLQQGTPNRGAYFLDAGEVGIHVRLPGGDALTLASRPAGSVLGEMALVERGQCTATVVARTPVTGIFLAGDTFRLLVARHSPVAIELQAALTRELCRKLADLNAQLLSSPSPEDLPATPVPPGDPLDGWPRLDRGAFEIRSFLPVLPLFADWEADAIDAFVSACRVLELPRGQAVFHEGAPATACYVTVRGAVEVSAPVRPPGGAAPTHLRRLSILGPGRLFGYRAVLRDTPQTVRVRVREPTTLLECPREEFLASCAMRSRLGLRLRAAAHAALLHALAQANLTLTRLVALAQVQGERRAVLEKALASGAARAG